MGWSDEPAESAVLFRVPPKGECEALLLGPVAWRTLHWAGGESVPCDGPGCGHCPKKTFERGYVEAFVRGKSIGQGKRRVILELHRQAWAVIDGRPPRGIVLKLTRGGGKFDAPQAKEGQAAEQVPAPVLDVKARMERIWRKRFGLFEPEQGEADCG
jgi:hypothetical protein